MLRYLDQIAEDNRIRVENLIAYRDRNGTVVRGHWRQYKDHRTWVEAHVRAGHKVITIKARRIK